MTQNIKSIIIGTLGILIFGIGAGLRFQAKDLSTFEVNFDMAGVPLKDKPDYNGQKYRAVDSNKQDSITDISLV